MTISEKLMFGIPSAILALIFLGIGFIIADFSTGRDVVVDGTVVERQYEASRTTTGTGLVVNPSNGQPSMVTTTDTTPERWNVIVSSTAWTGAATASPAMYAQAEPRRRVLIKIRVGRWTNSAYGAEVVEVGR